MGSFSVFHWIITAGIVYLFYRVFIGGKGSAPTKASNNPQEGQAILDEYTPASTPDTDHDNWEGAFWDVQSPRNISGNLHLIYKDGTGSQTIRDIRLMKYGPWDGGAILWAYCNLRQANRTFRTDRILSCTDLDTGDIINNLESWLDDRYMASPDRAIEQIIDTAWDALRVLFYVCKADGRLTQKERGIVRNAVRSISDHPAIDDARIDDMFNMIDMPTVNAFKLAFGRLTNQNRSLAEKVVIWSESIIATEKTVAAAEQEALDYLKARLAKAEPALIG